MQDQVLHVLVTKKKKYHTKKKIKFFKRNSIIPQKFNLYILKGLHLPKAASCVGEH
jgi:hypothetical protein